MTTAQHAGVSPARWAEFTYDQQVLMIANEMHRTSRMIRLGEWAHARRGFERVLQLTDLTIGGTISPTRRRELLRWRDLVAVVYLDTQPNRDAHAQAFRCLLEFTPETFRQRAVLRSP